MTVFVALAATVLTYSANEHPITGIAGAVMVVILATKMVLAMAYRPHTTPPPPGFRVTIAIAAYNEDPATLVGCLRSVLRQTQLPARVHVVDDGSASDEATAAARGMAGEFAAAGVDFEVSVQPTNMGKREALARVFLAGPDVDAYLCVDSDTILDPNALREASRPMADPRVHVVTGLVLAANRSTNLLTRLINLRYGNAFAYERAAYSRLAGSVLCACGSLALYRARVVHDNLDDFVGQVFLGRIATFGDDRRMTNYGLIDGRAVYQETARADTAVPERLGHFLRQQVRWNKSFFRESLWVLRSLPVSKPAWWITLLEVVTWVVYTGFVAAAAARGITGNADTVGYLVYIVLFGYARSVRYLDVPDQSTTVWQRVGAFLLAPLYGAIHIVALTPIRFYSLATLRQGAWGTRERVEVGLAGDVLVEAATQTARV